MLCRLDPIGHCILSCHCRLNYCIMHVLESKKKKTHLLPVILMPSPKQHVAAVASFGLNWLSLIQIPPLWCAVVLS